MTSLWPDSFDETTTVPPRKVFDEQGEHLQRLTKGVVYGEIQQIDSDALPYETNKEFAFKFNLMGRKLWDYRFTLLWFAHDIALYPVELKLDSDLTKELTANLVGGSRETVSDRQQLEELLMKIFHSNRVRTVIGSIMKLSNS